MTYIRCELCGEEFTYLETYESYGTSEHSCYNLRELMCPGISCGHKILIRMEPDWSKVTKSTDNIQKQGEAVSVKHDNN